jgi:ubiquinone/menaquinone biosynthesis C-methylase UbiE
MEQFTCSLCGGTEGSGCFNAYDFDHSTEKFELIRCNSCELVCTSPMPDQANMEQYYSKTYYGRGSRKFSGLIEFLAVLGNKFRAKKISKEIEKTRPANPFRRVLDIGCGRANLLRCMRNYGYECHGTERSGFQDDNQVAEVNIFKGSVSELEYKDGYFDAVVIWHVLEHLHDPFQTIDEIVRITRDEGLIVIAVPNFSSLQAGWFKSDWFHLDIPRHLYHFDVDILCRALKEKSYSIQSVSTTSLEQNIFGFVQSFMNKLDFLGNKNEFYKLLQHRSGPKQTFRLVLLFIPVLLILPLAIVEFLVSLVLRRGASAIIFARKVK